MKNKEKITIDGYRIVLKDIYNIKFYSRVKFFSRRTVYVLKICAKHEDQEDTEFEFETQQELDGYVSQIRNFIGDNGYERGNQISKISKVKGIAYDDIVALKRGYWMGFDFGKDISELYTFPTKFERDTEVQRLIKEWNVNDIGSSKVFSLVTA